MPGKVYIASPFFDDASKDWVTKKEEDFKGIKYSYFSPREDGLNFSEVKGQLRSDRIKLIFYNNYRQLQECDHICCNLMPCKGSMDIGTLWELGCFIGLHGLPDWSDSINQFYAVRDFKDDILYYCKELNGLQELNPINNTQTCYIRSAKELTYTQLEQIKVFNSGITPCSNDIYCSNPTYIVTDDFPWRLVMYMGYLYSKGIPYYTVSFKNYGSNIMIAASSKGHISLPGIVDDTYRDALL